MWVWLRYAAPWGLYCGLIVWLSSLPARTLPRVGVPDFLVHFVEYLILGLMTDRLGKGFQVRSRGMVVLFFGIGFGLLDEFHQSFVPGRYVEIKDLVADVVGFTVGMALYRSLEGFYAAAKARRV